MPRTGILRSIFRAVTLLLGTALLGIAGANWTVAHGADERTYESVRTVPSRRVGLVLGTSPRSRRGPNPFFERRLDAAAALYRAGKVRCILASGDHGTRYYDEVAAMRKGLIRRGVPADRIALDHAGFRTLDSLVRARRVFGVRDAVVVTDGFHLPRALFLARQNGIDAVGLSSVALPSQVAPWPATREIGARVLVMIDVLVGRQPKHLGPQEALPG